MPQAHPRSSGNLNDTHPRFSRDGKKVCIDSPHGQPADLSGEVPHRLARAKESKAKVSYEPSRCGTKTEASAEAGGNGRQLYLIDISKIVAKPPRGPEGK